MILILHHIEPEWESAFNATYLRRVRDYIRDNQEHISKIIYTSCSGDLPAVQAHRSRRNRATFHKLVQAIHDSQIPVVAESWDFAPYDGEDWPVPWGSGPAPLGSCIGVSSHHRYTYLYPWMHELREEHLPIAVAGGAKYECLLDLREALDHLGIQYETLHELVYE